MEYFNYFTEIESHFNRRRGTVLIVSPIDWALMEMWKDAGVPLEAALRGIDAAFDKYDRRPRKTRKINSLAYCQQEVMAAAEEMKDAAVGSTRDANATSIPNEDLATYLERNAEQIERAQVPQAIATLTAEQARTLRELATQARNQQTPADLEDLERRMTVMEEKLFAALLTNATDEQLMAARAEAERELAPYRGKMTGPQIDQLLRQYTNKQLLEASKLPRLSLFYL